MATRVVWLPGVMGSTIGVRPGGAGPVQTVWVEPVSLLAGGIVRLQLGPDGAGPGPLAGGDTAVVQGIFGPSYAPLAAFLASVGYDVLPLGYDWRRDLVSVGQAAWPQVVKWAGHDAVTLVAHSMGGLLARAMYGAALAGGGAGQIARIITIGTPHFGSMQAVRLWWRLPFLYALLRQYCGWGAEVVEGAGQDWLDAVIATMPGWYQLMPWRAAGPLWEQHPDQAALIYTRGWYKGANAYLMQTWLDLAAAVQQELAQWLPTGIMFALAGVGWETVDALDTTHSPAGDAGYTRTQLGDGLVTLAQAVPPGVPSLLIASPHPLQPLDPAVWGLLPALIGS